jgi:hypothetical protein
MPDGCGLNVDCQITEVCVEHRCVDACTVTDCGPNTDCTSINHWGHCVCLPGFTPHHYGCIISGDNNIISFQFTITK